ncbi:MAG: substrate-binding domain-containing protein [Spirochaetaceae bacterium]
MRKALATVLVLLLLPAFLFASGQAEEAAEAEEIRLAGIVFQNDQFMRIVQFGMQDAAEELGVELLLGNSDNSPAQEIEMVNNYISGGVDGIMITPLSATASVQALRDAHEEGIQIVTWNTRIDADFPVAAVESSQFQLGESTGAVAREYIQNELDGSARVAILAFDALVPEQSGARVDGFLSQIEDLDGVEIVAKQDAWLAEDAVAVSEDIITANPDLDLIYAANEGGTVGSVQGVRNAGGAGEIAVFGIDASEQLADFLLADDDILHATTGQQPYEIGYTSVEVSVAALQGEDVEKDVIVPGVLLTRDDPEEVREFRSWLTDIIDR